MKVKFKIYQIFNDLYRVDYDFSQESFYVKYDQKMNKFKISSYDCSAITRKKVIETIIKGEYQNGEQKNV